MAYGATTAEISQIGVGDPEAADWRVVIDRRESVDGSKVFNATVFIVVPYATVLYIKGWIECTHDEWWVRYVVGTKCENQWPMFFEFDPTAMRIIAHGTSFTLTRDNVRVY